MTSNNYQKPTRGLTMSNAKKEYKESLDELQRMLGYDDATNIFGQGGVRKLKEAVSTMDRHISQLIEKDDDQGAKFTKDEVKTVDKCVDMLLRKVTFEPITDWLRDFTGMFVDFVSQWNQRTVNATQITSKIMASKRIVDSNQTIKDAIIMMKRMRKKVEPILEKDPSSLDLSRAWAEKIREE